MPPTRKSYKMYINIAATYAFHGQCNINVVTYLYVQWGQQQIDTTPKSPQFAAGYCNLCDSESGNESKSFFLFIVTVAFKVKWLCSESSTHVAFVACANTRKALGSDRVVGEDKIKDVVHVHKHRHRQK